MNSPRSLAERACHSSNAAERSVSLEPSSAGGRLGLGNGRCMSFGTEFCKYRETIVEAPGIEPRLSIGR